MENHNSTLAAMSPFSATAKPKKPVGMPQIQPPAASILSPELLSRIPGTAAYKAAKGMSKINLPVYDNGGVVDVDDGTHQLAILQDGETVLPTQGAPADFAGRVLPNPHGIKPILDTEYQQPSKTDRLPKNARLSTDNTPLSNPKGDTSNPPAADDVIPTQGRLVSTEGQPTKGSLLADQFLKHIGMPSAMPRTSAQKAAVAPEVVAPGMPKINTTDDRSVAPQLIPSTSESSPVYGGPGAKAVAQGELIPEKQLPQDERKYKLAQYDNNIQAALDKGTPEGQEEADRLRLAKDNYVRSNPWGSASNHPGLLGKIGHVAEMVAARTPGIAPIVATLPGSEVWRGTQAGGAREDLEKDTQLATQRAGAVQKADRDQYDVKEVVDNRKDSPTFGQTVYAGVNKTDPTDVRYSPLQAAPKAGAEKTAPATADQIADYQQRIANSGLTGKALEVYGSVPKNSTAAELDKRFDEATKLRGMDATDQRNKIDEQQRKDNEAEHKREYNQNFTEKQKGKYYSYVDADGKVQTTTGDRLPDDANDVTPIKDFAVYKNEATAGDVVQQSLNRIRHDVEEHPEIFDNAKSRAILGNAVEDIERHSAGILIAGTGGSIPIPAGFGASVTTALQNHALDEKTADALRTYIADYKAAKDKAIVQQMALQGGKIGRGNATALKAIIDQLPNGDTPNSKTARRQLENLQQTQDVLMNKFPEELRKEKPYKFGSQGREAGNNLTVQTPAGAFTFKTQADADAFRKKAGL